MTIRGITIAVCLLDTALWVVAAVAYLGSVSDPATAGLDTAAGVVVTGLVLVTAVPASILAVMGRLPKTALTLAVAFPALFAVLFLAAVIAFA